MVKNKRKKATGCPLSVRAYKAYCKRYGLVFADLISSTSLLQIERMYEKGLRWDFWPPELFIYRDEGGLLVLKKVSIKIGRNLIFQNSGYKYRPTAAVDFSFMNAFQDLK